MMYYNLKKYKEIFFLDLFVYFIPFAIIIGNTILNSTIVLSIIVYITLLFKKKISYKKYKNYFNFFYILFLLLLINIFLSSNFTNSFISFLGILKNSLLFLILIYCFNEIDNFKTNFLKIIFFLLVFVILDVIFQHFFTFDIFGNKIDTSHGRRLSGPFGDEKVAGAFISKFFFISLIYLYIKKVKFIYIVPLIIIAVVTVILTNERSASIMIFTASLIFFVLCRYKLQNKIILLTITIFSFLMLINSNSNLKSHYTHVFKYFEDSHHKAHYLTSYEIFKDNKFFGSGMKTFRYLCNDDKYENIDSIFVNDRCSTHTHNIYFEILSETGLIGILFFVSTIFFILYNFIRNFFIKTESYNEILMLFCCFYTLFWPLQTTGSIFSTWNGIFYWIFFALFFSFRKKFNN